MKVLKLNILLITALITLIATLVISVYLSYGRTDADAYHRSVKAEDEGKLIVKVQEDSKK
ncbi:hypothetical protein [Flavobacterium sp.]|uniref:hypothetical protein n=1 Tax=Flavobacterium sp. TaxID=239 RepID=UPI00262E96C8|nr:hypothetical protein [Flavobacterium sp.]